MSLEQRRIEINSSSEILIKYLSTEFNIVRIDKINRIELQ